MTKVIYEDNNEKNAVVLNKNHKRRYEKCIANAQKILPDKKKISKKYRKHEKFLKDCITYHVLSLC